MAEFLQSSQLYIVYAESICGGGDSDYILSFLERNGEVEPFLCEGLTVACRYKVYILHLYAVDTDCGAKVLGNGSILHDKTFLCVSLCVYNE